MFVSLASSAEAVARPSLVLCGDARHSRRTSGCDRSLRSAYAFRILEAFNLAGVALEQRRRLVNAHADEVTALLANLSTLRSSPSAVNPVSSKNSRTLLQTAPHRRPTRFLESSRLPPADSLRWSRVDKLGAGGKRHTAGAIRFADSAEVRVSRTHHRPLRATTGFEDREDHRSLGTSS